MAEHSGSEVAAVGGAGWLGGINEGERAKVITAKLAAAALVSNSCDLRWIHEWTLDDGEVYFWLVWRHKVGSSPLLCSAGCPRSSPQTVQCGKTDKVERRWFEQQ